MIDFESHIFRDDRLNPQTETVKSWVIAVDEGYVRYLEKRKKFTEKKFSK